MRILAASLVFGLSLPFCGAADYQDLATARYGWTAMVARGDTSYIVQMFVTRSQDQLIQVEYRNGSPGNVIAMRFPDRFIPDVRQDSAAIDALRSALRSYLTSPDRKERSVGDVTCSLCFVDEPLLPVFSLPWFGYGGQDSDPEAGKTDRRRQQGEPGATDNPDDAQR